MRKRQTGWWTAVLSVAMAAAALAQPPPIREAEVREGRPLPSGIAVIQVRLNPRQTLSVPRLLFVCTLRQEFVWNASDGREVQRVIEPAVFTHREQNVRLVADLDRHVSFRVPLREEDLTKAYGPRTFRPGIPVSVSSVRIEAQTESGETLWTVNAPLGHVTRFEEAPASPARAAGAAP